MNPVRRYAASLAAGAFVVALFFVARPAALPEIEAQRLASRFSFRKLPLPAIAEAGKKFKSVRQMHPSLQRILAWISSLGAAVTLADLDGDGLANDLIHLGLAAVAKETRLPTELRWREPDGKVRATTLELQPGWHTIRLGRTAGDGMATNDAR
jgi:hypothetical protein